MNNLDDATPRSRAQRLVLSLMPRKWHDSIVRESRAWKMTCPECNAQQSVWNMGGIRWKAKGTQTFRARCQSCGHITTLTLQYHPEKAD